MALEHAPDIYALLSTMQRFQHLSLALAGLPDRFQSA